MHISKCENNVVIVVFLLSICCLQGSICISICQALDTC